MPATAITDLALSHVRSYRTATLHAGGRSVAIHGPNGAGKTNILEAISLLSPGRGLRRASTDEIARTPERIGWKVRATLDSLHQTHEIVTWADPGAARQVTIDGKQAPQTALGHLVRILWLVPMMDRLWLEGAAERRRFLDRMAMSFEPGHADATLAYEKAMRERNRLLKDNVRDPSWYAGLEAQMARYGAQVNANRSYTLARLTAAQADAKTAFPTATLSLSAPQDGPAPEGETDLASALAAGRSRDLAAGRTLTGPHRADLQAVYAAKGTPARNCSTGEQKALLISLVLANARALAHDTGAAPILLLDEVAAHLDADRRASLYAEIAALGAQAWMTGTEAELFEALQKDAMRMEVIEGPGGSTIRVEEQKP